MKKQKTIGAISFLYQGERLVVKASSLGRFKVPVTEVINGQLKTRTKNLTARQVITHDIIKKCDPTLYLGGEERLRVYQGGDCSYLPAHVDGIITKHDLESEVKIPKFKSGYKADTNSLKQENLDFPGWYPWEDMGYGD